MATTYKSTEVTRGDVPRAVTPGVYASYGSYTMTAGSGFIINDVVQMVSVPIGARILRIDLYTTDLDTHTTPLVTLSIGDATTANRFVAAAIIGRTGGVVSFPDTSYVTVAGFGYQYTVNDTIDVAVTAAPAATATTLTLSMIVLMAIDN